MTPYESAGDTWIPRAIIWGINLFRSVAGFWWCIVKSNFGAPRPQFHQGAFFNMSIWLKSTLAIPSLKIIIIIYYSNPPVDIKNKLNSYKIIVCTYANRLSTTKTGWWFQPSLKNICQVGSFPQLGVKINIFETTTYREVLGQAQRNRHPYRLT